MARIKIKMPSRISATVEIATRITDHNYGNHVGNDAIVSLIHEARVQWLALHGFTEFNAGGSSLIMGHLAVEYKKQIIYPCLLKIDIAIGELSPVSFELVYCLRNEHAEVMVNATTGLVCFDYEKNTVRVIPKQLMAVIEDKS